MNVQYVVYHFSLNCIERLALPNFFGLSKARAKRRTNVGLGVDILLSATLLVGFVTSTKNTLLLDMSAQKGVQGKSRNSFTLCYLPSRE